MVVLKMVYEGARPFWVEADVIVLQGNCRFDFASPSTHIFNIVFFWMYTVVMYFVRYTEKVNYWLVYSLYTLLAILSVSVAFGDFLFGLTYLY